MKKMNNKGFSLVELIIVIAIMAILIGVLAPTYMRYVEKTRISRDASAVDSACSIAESTMIDYASTHSNLDDISIEITMSKGNDLVIDGGDLQDDIDEVYAAGSYSQAATSDIGEVGVTVSFDDNGNLAWTGDLPTAAQYNELATRLGDDVDGGDSE